jgi:hypothetical protein
MPRRRSADTMRLDAEAYDMFRRGLSYRQIAAQPAEPGGPPRYRSPNAAFQAVRRAARELASDPLKQAAARQVFLDRFQDYRRAAQRVLTTRHYAHTQAGRLVDAPGGGFLTDDAPVLAALDRLCKIDDMELRVRDLYPATKQRIHVMTEDDVDAAIADLVQQVSELETGTDETAAADPGAG